MCKMGIFLLIVIFTCVPAFGQYAETWNDQAAASIDHALNIQHNTAPAKNVIVFVGDGMDLATVVASRIRQGELKANLIREIAGVENFLVWETFPHDGLVKTYTTDKQTPDSASAATAIFTGVKTKYGVVGLDDGAVRGDCDSATGNHVQSNLYLAHAAGKATGFVTTDSVVGATPAALYAHSPDRSWKSDSDIPRGQKNCQDLAYQLIMENDFINVILGGGRQEFTPSRVADPEHEVMGRRGDGNNLIGQWQGEKDSSSAHYVWNQEKFDSVDPTTTDYLLGLFEPDSLLYAADRASDPAGQPTLGEMTQKAIQILEKNENGFFLAVESALIGDGHHSGRAYRAIEETLELADAVAMATEMTNPEETLIIVTADQAHTMGIVGYQSKNNPILGLVDAQTALDRIPYTTLEYLNGPGGVNVLNSWDSIGKRGDYTDVDTESPDFVQDATVPLNSGTHGGSDVPVYASGPWSHIFGGVHEQNYLAHAVRYAACLDPQSSSACDIGVAAARPAYPPRK